MFGYNFCKTVFYSQRIGEQGKQIKQIWALQADHDDFDDLLESAIKTYQTNYNLMPSGNLYSKTVQGKTVQQLVIVDMLI